MQLVIEEFGGRVGETFTATAAEGEPFELTLAACERGSDEAVAHWEAEIGKVPFSLMFETGEQAVWPQQTFTLRHGELGEFPLFLVPLAPGRYQAVIS
jgi:hypothetical protein